MANIFQISPATPLKWYRQSDIWNALEATLTPQFGVFNPAHNTRHFDDDFWERNLNRWMDEATYFQPWQTKDIVKEQFLGVEEVGGVSYTVRLCTPEGKVVKSVLAVVGSQVGSNDQYVWEYEFPLWDVAEGKYYFQMWYVPDTPGTDYFIVSAPVEIKRYHQGTQLYRYYHSSNDQDIFYETDIQFYIRLHSQLMEFQPDAKRFVYEDQPLNLTMLSGTTFRTWQAVLGGMGNDFPEYMLDKIDRIFNHDYLAIDGREYTAIEGAKLDIDRVKNKPLYSAKIAVREKDNVPALIVYEYPEIVCCDAPTSRRFYIDSYTVNAFGITNPIEKHFAGVDEFLGYLNTVVFVDMPEGTYFATSSQGKIVIHTNNLAYSMILAGLTINNILQGWIACEVADGDFDLEITATAFNYAFDAGDMVMTMTAGVTSATVGASYTDPTMVYVFMDDADQLDFTGSTVATIRTIDGQLPASCTEVNLTSLSVQRVLGNIFDRCAGSLDAIRLGGNLLTALNVNQCIMWAYEAYELGAFFLPGATGLIINTQTPSAPPAADSGIRLFMQRLRSAGCPVTTD